METQEKETLFGGVEYKGVLTHGDWTTAKLTQLVKGVVAPHKLVYLCVHGSHLHGTHTETSDMDVKGLFLPSKEDLLLGHKTNHFHYSTGSAHSKNGVDDLDVDLWSVHYWFELLEKGDSNALSLLFAAMNSNMVLFADKSFVPVLMNYSTLYNPNNVSAFTGFAKGQAVKYTNRSKNINTIKSVLEVLYKLNER